MPVENPGRWKILEPDGEPTGQYVEMVASSAFDVERAAREKAEAERDAAVELLREGVEDKWQRHIDAWKQKTRAFLAAQEKP